MDRGAVAKFGKHNELTGLAKRKKLLFARIMCRFLKIESGI
jgi:hypothetical protein